MISKPSTFKYEHDEESGLVTIALDRPERLNALTFEVYEELRDTFLALAREPGVRAIVLTGSGRAFCSGGDVEAIIGELFARDAKGLLAFTQTTGALVLAIRRCLRPVVAAVNGTCAGAGAVIAAACDVRIASEDARIAFLFAKVGLSGADMGACWLLPRIVGHGRATEILMTGDFVDAREAERIGLYNRVVPKEKVGDEARAFALRLAAGPTLGLEITKTCLDREWAMSVESAIQLEAEVQALCMQDPNFREAHAAFVGKRKPVFK